MNFDLPEWKDDCQGKQDMDGPIISLSTRYYPPNYANTGWPSSIRVEILDGDGRTLCAADFEAETEEKVKELAEAWAQEQCDRVVAVIAAVFA